MGEGLRVLSELKRVKTAILAKIESVDTSVSGLPNTLDTQFSDVKKEFIWFVWIIEKNMTYRKK